MLSKVFSQRPALDGVAREAERVNPAPAVPPAPPVRTRHDEHFAEAVASWQQLQNSLEHANGELTRAINYIHLMEERLKVSQIERAEAIREREWYKAMHLRIETTLKNVVQLLLTDAERQQVEQRIQTAADKLAADLTAAHNPDPAPRPVEPPHEEPHEERAELGNGVRRAPAVDFLTELNEMKGEAERKPAPRVDPLRK